MVDDSDERRRRDDLGWLYGSPRPKTPEHTTVMGPDELAALRGTPQHKPGPPGSGKRTPPPPRQAAPPRQPAPPRPAGPPARRRRRRRGRVLRNIVALLVLWLVYLLAMPLLAWSLGSTVASTPEGDRPANQPGTAILLVGSDSRENLSQRERGELGTGSADGGRTDTMMILYTPRTGRSVLISLPRDSYVAIPGQGRSKLNAAYALGGPKLLMQTVEQNTGLRMDGYLEVGFAGFVGVVEAVGGVEVCLDNPIQDQDSHLDLPAGCQTLNGVNALGYVRMRKADPQGDFGRMQRQREVIGLLVDKIVSPWTVLNPIRWFQVNWAAKDSLRRGVDTGLTALPGLSRGMYSVSIGNGLTLTVPVSNANATTPAGSSVIWDEAAAHDMFGQIASGDTSRLDEYAK